MGRSPKPKSADSVFLISRCRTHSAWRRKLGHFFTRARWIGIETGVFYSTPHIKEGSLVFSGPGGSLTSPILAGVHQRMITWDNMHHFPVSSLSPSTIHWDRTLRLLCFIKWS